MYMALGAVVFLGFAFCILYMWTDLSRLGAGNAKRQAGIGNLSPKVLLAIVQNPSRSVYQQDPPTPDDARRATEQMLEDLLKDKTPEEREAFLKKIENAKREREDLARRKQKPAGMLSWFISIAGFLWPVFMLFLTLIFLLPGGACLVKSIRFFRDRLDLSVDQNGFILRRPKLFGGMSKRILPLRELRSISLSSTLRRNRGNHRVHWFVIVEGTNPAQPFMRFEFGRLPPSTSLEVPPDNVRSFASAIQQMTGLKVVG